MNIEFTTHSWQYIPKIVYSLLPKKNQGFEDVDLVSGRNFSVILLLPVWIESVIYTVLSEYLTVYKIKIKNEKESFTNRLMKKTIDDLEKASWGDYNKLSELILGKKLDKFTDSATWNAINILYDFRNKVLHGKPIGGRISNVSINLNGIHSNIMDHLLAKKIIKKRTTHIYTDATVNYFIGVTESFTKSLMDELQGGEEDYNMADKYESVLMEAKGE